MWLGCINICERFGFGRTMLQFECIRSFSQIPAEEIIKKCLNNFRWQYRSDRTSGFCSEKAQKTATCFHDEKSTQPSIV